MSKTVVYSTNPYLALHDISGLGPSAKYHFDGTTYATLNTPWAAGGRPREYEINFNADAVSTGQEQYLFSGIEGGIRIALFLQSTNAMLQVHYLSAEGTQANEVVLSPLIEAGTDYKVEIKKLGDDAVILINGQPGTPYLTIPSMGIQPPISTIGARDDATLNFTGTIWGVNLTDESPIQGDFYQNQGASNTLYGTLDTPVVVAAGEDATISFNYRKSTISYSVNYRAFGSQDGTTRFQIHGDTVATAPNGFTIFVENVSEARFDTAFSDISFGQDCSVVLHRVSGVWSMEVDSVDIPWSVGSSGNGEILVDEIYRAASSALRVGCIMSDLHISSAGGTYTYPLTEVDGDSTLIENTTIAPLFFDPAAAVKGEGTCLDKFAGTASNAMGDLTVNSLGGNTAVTDFNSTKGFRPGPTDSMGWLTYDADAFHNGFTLYMEVESFIFADDFVTPENDMGCLMYSGGGEGRGFAYYNDRGAWDANRVLVNAIKTRADELPEFVGVYFTFIPTVGTRIYIEEVLVQEYAYTGEPGNVTPMGIPGYADVYNLSAYRRNLVLWQEPLDLSTVDAPAVYYLGDSFTQWGNYQSGNLSNTTTDDDPNNNPPAGWQGVTTDNPYFDAKYELKNESTVAQFHRTFAEKNYNPTIYFYGQGGATVTSSSPNPVGASRLEHRVDAALDTGDTGTLMPAGGEAGRCDIWVSQIGTNDINFAMMDDPNTPDSFFDGMIPVYQAQIDRMIADGARHIMVCNITPRYTETGQPQWPSQVDYVNRLYAEHIDGYRDMVTLVDVFTGWDFSMTDGLDPGNENHPGPKGQRRIADRVGAALPVFSPAWSDFNGRWDSTNFEYIPDNSREYPMNEGSGLVLEDSLHPDEIDYYATLSSDAGWENP